MSIGYRSKLDESDELNRSGIQFFQEVIEMLHWIIELGHIDIMVEVSMLSPHLACPKERHLQESLHIMEYLKAKYK